MQLQFILSKLWVKRFALKTFISDISRKTFPVHERIPASVIRPSIYKVIVKRYPDFDKNKFISISELNKFREEYISDYLSKELGEITQLESKVLETLTNNTNISQQLDEDDNHRNATPGQKLADKVASFGGSWVFILSFLSFLLLWIVLNYFILSSKAFDPYPFILLNLILSCVAAIQAPIIMMSQNRQEEKDRNRAKNDYMINLKSELEIRALHEKLDHLLLHQQQELIEIQKVQIEMMNDILDNISRNGKGA